MRTTLVTSLLVSASLWGCAQDAPQATSELFDRYAATFVPPATSAEEALTVQTVFIGQVNAAKRSLDLAVEGFDDELSAQAIIDASLRGVAVRVVGDEDRRGDAGFTKLRDAGIPMAFGDGQLPWTPSPSISMVRGSDDNRMSHNFMVVDGATVFVASNGPVVAGGVRAQLYNVMTSEDLSKDFTGVFQQMFGGVFATTVTSYGEPMPSNTNNRTRMQMQDGSVLSTWFGPQEPIIKEAIDRIYAARSSVYMATTGLYNKELVDALRYKAAAGFSVKVVVDAAGADAVGSRLSRLEGGIADPNTPSPNAKVVRRPNVGFNTLIIDAEPSAIDGTQGPATMFVPSQPFIETIPYVSGAAGFEPRPCDTFFDSNAWAIAEQSTSNHPLLRQVAQWIIDESSR
jgi:phosphatidylserine/phosphatidylglycerophosphate/cardiolipin synthase-like enzyme